MVTVKQTEDSISYILKDERQLSLLEEKVIRNRMSGNLTVPYQMRRNGEVQLLVMIPASCGILERVGVDMEPEALFRAVLCLNEVCEEIEKNGFLKLEHLDLNLSHILADSEGDLRIIYLPVAGSLGTVLLDKDSVLRAFSAGLAAKNVNSRINNSIQEFREDLQNNACPMQRILGKIRAGEYGGGRNTGREQDERQKEESVQKKKEASGACCLVLAENQRRLEISKERFVVGKNPEQADGVISGHPAVSRRHCAITCENGRYFIHDLNSKNGTYVNDVRLSGSRVPLKNGDNIRLADCVLIFREEKG